MSKTELYENRLAKFKASQAKKRALKQAKAGRIPCFRIGAAVRFCPKTVADWLRRR